VAVAQPGVSDTGHSQRHSARIAGTNTDKMGTKTCVSG
jgi:hypothetical protein